MYLRFAGYTEGLEEKTTTNDDTTLFPEQIESKDDLECKIIFSAPRISMAVVIAVVCVFGNSTVLFIYTRSKAIAESKIFELAFAVLDIFACLLLMSLFFTPSLHCFTMQSKPFMIHIFGFVAAPTAVNGYYGLLLCVAVDRFCAVFYPLQFKSMRKKYIGKMMAAVTVYILLIVIAFNLNALDYRAMLSITVVIAVVALVVIVILFTLIVVRIRRHSAQRAALGVGGQDAQHLTAVKMFSLITAFYLLGYVPLCFRRLNFGPIELNFFYFVNHVCNPIIYVIFNDRFRRDVTNLAAKMCHCF